MVFICYLLLIFSILVCTCGGTCDPILSDEQDTNEDKKTGKAPEGKAQEGNRKDTCVINMDDNANNETEPLIKVPVALYSINK